MNDNEINDIRTSSDFANKTFSGYAKSKVKGELIKSIKNCEIEPAFYWSIELICAGHYNELWNIIIYYSITSKIRFWRQYLFFLFLATLKF